VLMPLCAIIVHLSGQFVLDSFQQHEHSPSAGGLIRWPIKAAIPVGFTLLGLQALSELFKRVIFLRSGEAVMPDYERPLQ